MNNNTASVKGCYDEPDRIPVQQNADKRSIVIQQLDYGYVVIVGCKHFAIEDSDRMLTHIAAYLADPAAAEEAYYKGELKIGE